MSEADEPKEIDISLGKLAGDRAVQMRTALLAGTPVNRGEVHLWTVRLVGSIRQIDGLYKTLSSDEKRRADAFWFEKHKSCFIIARGLLRSILGWYVGQLSQCINFQYGPQGKPTLCEGFEQVLHFNLAHSDDYVLYAFTTEDCELGVDLELVRELPDAEALADHFFAKEESADLLGVASERRTEAFFNCWTRKEAYLKATGKGLSMPLDTFQVSVAPDQPAAFLNLHRDRFHISQWTLFHLVPVKGYVGALAIRSRNCVLRERLFDSTEECLNFLSVTRR